MKAYELILLLSGRPPETEVRIGSAFDDGPYSHQALSSVHKGRAGDLILCGDDTAWADEQDDVPLEILWPKK